MSGFWGRYNNMIFSKTFSLTVVFVVPFLACFDFSSGLVYVGPLGCNGANFCPGPSVGVLGLDRQRS